MDDRVAACRLESGQNTPAIQPLLLAFLAMAGGIALNVWLTIPVFVWSAALIVCGSLWAVSFGRRRWRLSAVLVLLGVVCCGGIWHEFRANWIRPNAIGQFVSAHSAPALLHGTLATNPAWVPAPSEPVRFSHRRATRTRFTLDATAIRDGSKMVPASGQVEVFVDGQASGLVTGDPVSIAGNLGVIADSGNPGQFDFASFFRARGVECQMSVGHPDAITRLDNESNQLARWSGVFKLQLDGLIWQVVSPDRAGLASAMLLGNREQLDRERRQQFLLTGTVHLLAISGLHVGILASLFLMLPRTGMISRRAGLLLTVGFVIAYAWLVEFRPPVVRAGILISVYCYCKWVGRDAFSFNSLALAGLIVLLVNPADLFSTGAQLSFLAVATLVFTSGWLQRPAPPTDPIDRLIARTRSTPARWIQATGWTVWQAVLVSLVIWLVALPLVAAHFHIVAPIALLINPLLMLPVTVALASGFGVLLFGWLVPPLAGLCGSICDQSLYLIQELVRIGQSIPGSHFWTDGPSWPAIAVFYLVLGLAFLARPRGVNWTTALALCGLWLVAGWWLPALLAGHAMQQRTTLACTFVDVGHGSCVLLEFPGGHNVLYDCGSIGGGELGARNASGVLWSRGIRRLDAVVISHADADHFNGLPLLADRFAIDRLIISRRMMAQRDRPEIGQLLELVQNRGMEIQPVGTGDELSLAGGIRVDVLNPPPHGQSESDNADSVVLDIGFAGRRLLLPGDLEREGLDSLLRRAAARYDVVMAPHHGSPNSRPREFLDWANPGYVVVSSRRGTHEPPDGESRFAPRFFHTGRDGAVRVVVQQDGRMSIQSWRQGGW